MGTVKQMSDRSRESRDDELRVRRGEWRGQMSEIRESFQVPDWIGDEELFHAWVLYLHAGSLRLHAPTSEARSRWGAVAKALAAALSPDD